MSAFRIKLSRRIERTFGTDGALCFNGLDIHGRVNTVEGVYHTMLGELVGDKYWTFLGLVFRNIHSAWNTYFIND